MALSPNLSASASDIDDTPEAQQVIPASTETIVYRVNAGSTDVAAIDGGPVWTGDLALENGTGPVSVTGDVEHEFTSKSTDSEAEVTYTDPAVADYAPWELFVHERHDKIRPLPNDDEPLTYNFDVETGATYKITLLYVENWTGAFRIPQNDRVFDVTVDGTTFAEFADMNPLGEAAAALGQDLPPTPSKMSAKQPFLGTVLTRELVYTAVDEELNLTFIDKNQNPKINAIQISQILEMPSEIDLSATQVAENAAGAVVGEVTVTDPDGGDAPEITVSDGRFEVADGMLKLKSGISLDFEEAYSIPLTLTVTDADGLSLAQEFEIAVQDVAEGRLSAVTNVVEGSNDGETLKGTGANDLIVGLGGKDTLVGRKGDDIMAGGKGADKFVGGKGFDTLDYSDSAKGVTVNLQKGVAKGGDARGDKFKSMEGVIGSDENDKLLGSKAGNVLIGGAGADVLNGRGGKDWADYSGSEAGVTVNLATRSGVGGDAEGDRLLKIENVHGSTMKDTLIGDGGKNVLVGDDGRDKLTGGGGGDKLDGGAGNDRVLGGGGADSFIFDEGNDKLVGGKGRDTVMFDGDFADFGVTLGRKVIVTFEEDRDVLTGMERLEFDDTTYAFQKGNWVELG
ncbi:MAG: malectin domain-containing carbohydrate-binding protein [Limimaricola soesokkakensis]|uniref:malectin domain-containing carbohydrate-binding protein n=1 Tax=Limimaricola soesokkakensis TaxID=1343159 RepID=UPI00405972F2